MKIKPILFSTPMVQAILGGRKTQTRRTKGLDSKNEFPDAWNRKNNPMQSNNRFWDSRIEDNPNPLSVSFGFRHNDYPDGDISYMKAPVMIGDILWVRETFEIVPIENAPVFSNETDEKLIVKYKADNEEAFKKWKPSIFMPKEACRIFLEVTNVRVERLQDITESDAIAEGINPTSGVLSANHAKSCFQSLWQMINGTQSWHDNPWVWVYEFKQIDRPSGF